MKFGDYVPIHSVTYHSLAPVYNNVLTHHGLITFHSVASGDLSDFGVLINFDLGSFNNDVHQLTINVSIANDSIPEDAEVFSVNLTLDSADQARLGNRVTVSPEVATVTIKDDDSKHLIINARTPYIKLEQM